MQNLDFEYSVLASLINSEDTWSMYNKIIDHEVFTDTDISEYLKIARKFGTADMTVLLSIDPALTKAVEKVATAQTFANPIAQYRHLVHLQGRRRLKEAGKDIQAGLDNPKANTAQLAGRLIESAQRVVNASMAGTTIPTYGKDTISTMLDDIRLEVSGKGRMLTTGFPTIDDRFGKIYEGDYVVIGANQSHGKTAFAVQMFAEMLIDGKRGIYFTMEIKNEILTRRMISYLQQVQLFGLTKETPKSTFNKISAGMDQIAGFGERMILHDQPAMTPSMIEEKVLQCLAIAPLDFIIIDHIHKMLPDGKSTGQYEKLTVISGALQAIGLKYKIPVIALAQLNRQPSNEDKFPKLSHLRDSGAIEADARKIFLIARPFLYDLKNTQIPKDEAVLIVAKNDKGECGTVDLKYNGSTFTFTVPPEETKAEETF